MGKTRIEELCYELYGSSKQHDSWQRYAMVRELRELMKRPKASGFDHFERSGVDRRFGGGQFHEGDRQTYGSSAELLDLRFREYLMLRNDDDDETWTWTETDQAFDDEDLVETEIATDPIETEHGTVSLVPEAQEKESIPQFQVPIANSEIVRSIEPGKVDLGLENLEYAVLNENLEQEWDQQNVNKKIDVDGDVVDSPWVSVKRDGVVETQTCISRRANYVWKPGELGQVMVIDGVVSLGKHVKLFDCVALPLITPPSSVLQVFSHANRSVWEPGGFHCVLVQENHVQHERNKAEGVGFFVQRIGVASEMENQAVTAGVVYGKRSDRVWEPGGLPTKLNMWDWTEKTRHSFLQSEKFQPFHQNQVFDELEVVESKSSTNPMLGSMLKRHHKRQQVRKLRLSPQPWLFKFKQKLIRLQIRDKEFQIAMPLAPKILKVHHMPNYLVIVEAAAQIYPTVEYLSQFSSKVGFDKEHSSSSLRANQIWDPGGKFSTSEATCEQPRKHINTTEVFSSTAEATEENFIAFCTNIILLNLEVKVFSKGKICYR